MSGTIGSFIIQLIAGAVGGNAAGGLLKNINLGPLGNTIAGAAGGGIGGSILSGLIPALSSAASGAGGFDIGVLAGQLAGGGITGRDRHGGGRSHQKCLDQKSLTKQAILAESLQFSACDRGLRPARQKNTAPPVVKRTGAAGPLAPIAEGQTRPLPFRRSSGFLLLLLRGAERAKGSVKRA